MEQLSGELKKAVPKNKVKKKETNDICTNCGLCCYLPDGSPCKWLRWKEDGKSFCEVYETRLGRYLGQGFYCEDIMKVVTLYKDCPYNELKMEKAIKDNE